MSTIEPPSLIDSKPIYNTGRASLHTTAAGNVGIPNINAAERRKRLAFGLMVFAIAIAILAVLVATGRARVWRLPLVLLFWGAASGYFRWRDQTCVGLARLDSRKLGDTTEKIEDAAELAQVQQQAIDEFHPYYVHYFDQLGRSRGRNIRLSRSDYEWSARLEGAYFVGSPQQIIDKPLYQHEMFGHQRFIPQIDIGGLPYSKVAQTIELLATEVAPVVRHETATKPASQPTAE